MGALLAWRLLFSAVGALGVAPVVCGLGAAGVAPLGVAAWYAFALKKHRRLGDDVIMGGDSIARRMAHHTANVALLAAVAELVALALLVSCWVWVPLIVFGRIPRAGDAAVATDDGKIRDEYGYERRAPVTGGASLLRYALAVNGMHWLHRAATAVSECVEWLLHCCCRRRRRRRRQQGLSSVAATNDALLGNDVCDKYGGDRRRGCLNATGFFRVELLRDGRSSTRWSFVSPEGHPFLSVGVVSCYLLPGYNAYSDRVKTRGTTGADSDPGWAEAWADRAVAVLRRARINTLGAWCYSPALFAAPGDRAMVHTLALGLDFSSGAKTMSDVFSREWAAAVRAEVAAKARPSDPYLLGYFVANEMRWGAHLLGLHGAGAPPHPGSRAYEASRTLLQQFLDQDAATAGKRVAVAHLLRWCVRMERGDVEPAALPALVLADCIARERARDASGSDVVVDADEGVGADEEVEEGAALAAVNRALGTQFATADELLSGRGAFSTFARLRAGASPRQFALSASFCAHVAVRFFAATARALRRADPQHLVLGARELSLLLPREAIAAAAAFCDVISVNAYAYVHGVETFAAHHFSAVPMGAGDAPFARIASIAGDKPVLVSECGFRCAADGRHFNTEPPGFRLYGSEAGRARAARRVLGQLLGARECVGVHIWRWADNEVEARGENNAMGLVSEFDEPHAAYIDAIAAAVGDAEADRGAALMPLGAE